jgi:hypothetical protein
MQSDTQNIVVARFLLFSLTLYGPWSLSEFYLYKFYPIIQPKKVINLRNNEKIYGNNLLEQAVDGLFKDAFPLSLVGV